MPNDTIARNFSPDVRDVKDRQPADRRPRAQKIAPDQKPAYENARHEKRGGRAFQAEISDGEACGMAQDHQQQDRSQGNRPSMQKPTARGRGREQFDSAPEQSPARRQNSHAGKKQVARRNRCRGDDQLAQQRCPELLLPAQPLGVEPIES